MARPTLVYRHGGNMLPNNNMKSNIYSGLRKRYLRDKTEHWVILVTMTTLVTGLGWAIFLTVKYF